MTKEEAKALIEKWMNIIAEEGLYFAEEYRQAFTVAIEALKQEPCEDAISRQAAIDTIESWLSCDDYNEAERHIMRAMQSVLYDLSSVNLQEPKTGHWVEENINGGRKVSCSECGCMPPFEHVSSGDVYSANGYGVIHKTKFCHNCGAKMVEPQESEDKE